MLLKSSSGKENCTLWLKKRTVGSMKEANETKELFQQQKRKPQNSHGRLYFKIAVKHGVI